MTFSLSRTDPHAGPTLSASSFVEVGVLGCVLMLLGAMSFVSPLVCAVSDAIERIARLGVPAQIADPVVRGIWVGVVACFLAIFRHAIECHQNKTTEAKILPRAFSNPQTEIDAGASVFNNEGAEPLRLGVSKVSVVGHFVVLDLWDGRRQPSFFHSSIVGTHYE